MNLEAKRSATTRRGRAFRSADFYVAHLLTGAVAMTIDGVTTPGGRLLGHQDRATMQVAVPGEFAVLETSQPNQRSIAALTFFSPGGGESRRVGVHRGGEAGDQGVGGELVP